MSDYDATRDPRPATEPNSGRHAELLEEARDNSRRANEAYRKSFLAEQDDQLFLAGHHWDPTDKKRREDAGLVTLTINDLGQFLDQVVGDERMNPTSIKISPADMLASTGKFVSVTGKSYEGHEVRAGLIRELEFQSNASMHYNIAGQHAAESGRGWLRVYHDYTNDASFVQDICIERIKNRWSVLPDHMVTQPDYSDQNFAFIGAWMPLKAYNRKYPGTAPGPIGADEPYWGQREGFVRLAEYYWREETSNRMVQLDNGSVVLDVDKRLFDAARASGRVIAERKVRRHKVRWCKMSYNDIIEGPYDVPGSTIPLVPVLGKVIEGPEDDFVYGLFRFAKEPAMMENYWMSSATQRISQMPNAPWLVTDSMIEGKANQWAEANRGSPAFLSYNPDPEAPAQGGKPERIQPAQIPQGEMQMLLAFGDKKKAAVGFHDAAVGYQRNQQSGIAIERLQQESDVGSFVFQDNLRMAVGRVGKIIDEWIPVIYDSERFITVRHPNGDTDMIEINKVGDDGRLMNDLGTGRYNAHATAGPAYDTLREEGASLGLELVKALASVGDGAAVPAVADIVVEQMDFPGANRMAKRLRKMVPPNLLDESELTEEERNAPPPQPTPQEQVANAMAQAQQMEAQATMAKAEATMDTADATRATARADIVEASVRAAAALNPQPEEGEEGGAGKPVKAEAGKLDEATQQLMRDLVLNTLAEALVDMQQENPPQPPQQPTQGA